MYCEPVSTIENLITQVILRDKSWPLSKWCYPWKSCSLAVIGTLLHNSVSFFKVNKFGNVANNFQNDVCNQFLAFYL